MTSRAALPGPRPSYSPGGEIVRELIARASEIVGSEEKLGKACGFTQNAIWQAKRKGRVTAEMAVAIELATAGRIQRAELRPDLWPLEAAT